MKIRRPDMRQLVSGLSAEEANRVVRKLDELKIEYTLTEGGTTVQVPTAEVNRVRLELAGAGLLQKNTVGFELFDRVNLNTTDFSERVNYLRAMQGELAETISSISAVQSVRVHLNIPREAAFLSEAHKATASVMLTLKPGQTLSRHQCKGILNLVASSVEGLTPEAVTLTDTSGSFLYSGSEEMTGGGSSEEEQQARLLQRNAQSVLDSVLGPGRGIASVHVEFLKDKKQISKEQFEPGPDGKPFEKSHHQTEESYHGMSKNGMPGGIPTPAPNPTTTPAAGATPKIAEVGKAQPQYSQTSQQIEYQMSRRTETVEESPNKIHRLTASVLVDSQANLDKVAVDSLTQAVSLALGIDTSRGDQFNLKIIPFNRDIQEEEKRVLAEAQTVKQKQDEMTVKGIGAAVGGALLLAGLMWLAGRRRQGKAEQAQLATLEEAGLVGGHVNISLPAEDPVESAPLALPSAGPSREALLEHRPQSGP